MQYVYLDWLGVDRYMYEKESLSVFATRVSSCSKDLMFCSQKTFHAISYNDLNMANLLLN